jgi:ketosteroid isomerase-like protein
MNDRMSIAAVQNAYGVALDQRDFDALSEVFVADCVVHFAPDRTWAGRAEFQRWAADFHVPIPVTLHQVSSHAASVDGDHATASCGLHALLVGHRGFAVVHVFARYTDELVRQVDGWRIVRRRSDVLRRVEVPAAHVRATDGV